MTEQEIVRELRAIRYEKPPTLTDIARAAGVSRPTVYHLAYEGTASPATLAAIGSALQAVKNGRVSQTPLSGLPKPIAGHPTR